MIYSAITKLTDDLAVDLAEFRLTHGKDFNAVFPSEAAELKSAGARLAGGKFKLPRNMWGLVRRVFYRPEAVSRGLDNLKNAPKPQKATGIT